MKLRLLFMLCIAAAALEWNGCSASHSSKAQDFLEARQYDSAIQEYVQALREDSTRSDEWKGLGSALAGRGDTSLALSALHRALSIDPDDGETLLLLGSIHEDKGDYAGAISYYRLYTRASSLGALRSELEARLEYLTQLQLKAEARLAVEMESSIEATDIPGGSLAVLPFVNLGARRDLDPLQKGIAEMVITDLTKVKTLTVVERVRIQALLDEIGFGASEFVKPESGARIGRLLGVSSLLIGSIVDLDEGEVRLDAGVTDARDGSFSKAADVSGDLERFFRMEKELVFSVLDRMNVVPTEAERKEILIIPTESMLALLAYSRGLELEDRGDAQGAREQYQQAASIDPEFQMAKERSRRVEQIDRGKGNRSMIRRSMRIRRLASLSVRARLQKSGQFVKAGVLPGRDLRKAYQEREGDQGFGLVQVEVSIPVP